MSPRWFPPAFPGPGGRPYTRSMTEPASPSVGLAVVHLFFVTTPLTDRNDVLAAVKEAEARGDQVVCAAMLGHKADLGVMALSSDQWNLRRLQTALVGAGLELVDSYVSLTETSEYAQGVPDEMKQARLHPVLPPEGKPAFCFYPMSKKRDVGANWFALDYDRRKELMYEHGASGRKFAGRVQQVVTGSTGTDDYEWGVTLFCVHPDDVKDVVYTMRFDAASAQYGEFGPFYVGMVADPQTALSELGVD
jgi:peroxiredoxin